MKQPVPTTEEKSERVKLNNLEDAVQILIQTLLKSRQTVSFAESCTGGLLSSKITEVSGVSSVFMGSVVSYSNEAKVEVLGVGSQNLQSHGAVSQVVAQEMAQGVRHRFHTDWGISITGIAGPTGGSEEKPVGTVWIGVCGPQLASSEAKRPLDFFVEARKYFFKGNRRQIQVQSAQAALELLNAKLNGSN
jgi:nicotinamide-nucleotide amidase